MSLTACLDGDTRKGGADVLIRNILDQCHKGLQAVIEQGVDGDDESR
jgi:hypothetical protein